MNDSVSDRLILEDISVMCRVGVYAWEKEKDQELKVDLRLAIDAAQAARSDQLADAVDYAHLVNLVRTHLKQKHYQLVETVAQEIADLVLAETKTAWAHVSVKKFALAGVGATIIQVERRRG